ncbi:MAG: hypothetical protein KAI24_23490, partial [Planctomycetes bacterium]|nr:hypothetical protein [Planctomycetota bacterium]
VCGWHPDGKPLLAAVTGLRERFAPAAGAGSPDTAADVLFAARSRLRFQWRDYRGAFERIDAFLAAHPDAAEVVAARAAMLDDGRDWLDKRLRRLDRALQQGDLDHVERDLESLDRWVAVPEWRDDIERRRRQLDAQR